MPSAGGRAGGATVALLTRNTPFGCRLQPPGMTCALPCPDMDLRFASPWMLLLLLALPAVAVLARRRGATAAVRVGSVRLASAAPVTWRVRFEPALTALRLLAAALLVVSLARPQRGEATTETTGNGVDIALAFDISTSMSLPFTRQVSKLQATQTVLSSFVQTRQSDRIGLVVFQGSSLTLSPLTTDYNAIAQDVRAVDSIRLRDGTAIGGAMGDALNLLRPSSAASRIVILLTDGENNVFELEPLAAARLAEALGVRVYTIGVVTRGDPRGSAAVDEEALRQIAQITGGSYSRAEDPAALSSIYQQIDALEKSRFPDRRVTRFNDIAPPFLAAAALALALEAALRYVVFRRPA